jgi:hypothetical protein
MKRIINKQTGVFLRDDFTFDKNTETGLNVNPAQGFYLPKWDGEKWVESLTAEEIQALKTQISYDQLVSDLIRAKYTVDQELAINRQRDTKPEEFQAYFDFCEKCKQKAYESII